MLSEEYGVNTQLTAIYRMMDLIDDEIKHTITPYEIK
jgi:hypothetical protein